MQIIWNVHLRGCDLRKSSLEALLADLIDRNRLAATDESMAEVVLGSIRRGDHVSGKLLDGLGGGPCESVKSESSR